MKSIKVLPFVFLILFAVNCKKDDQFAQACTSIPEQEETEAHITFLICKDIYETKAFLADLYYQGIFLRSVSEDTSHYILTFENDSIYGLKLNCFTSIQLRPADWKYDLTYSDGSTQTLGYIGSINLEAELNPSGYAPLTALLSVSAVEKGKVSIRVVGRNNDQYEVIKEFDDYSTEHTVPVLGLYGNYENLVEVSYLSEAGTFRQKDSIIIPTEPLIANLPGISVTRRMELQMTPGMSLINYRFLVNPNVPFMMDAFGEIRWYLDFRLHPDLDKLDYIHGLKRLNNGNLYFLDASDETIYEIDMLGNVLNNWQIPEGYVMHHDIYEKTNGNFLLTVSNVNSIHLNGNETNEDYIMEIDRQSGNVVMIWDLKEPLDEYRVALKDNLGSNPIDWIHVNAVIEDTSDNSIIVSGRYQGVFKIDYSNQLVWAFGIKTGWGQNRYGQNMNDFLLTAVDNSGQIIGDKYQDGTENHPDFEWPWYQHAPLLLPNGNILLFDNGPTRNFMLDEKYSRAVEYEIDPLNKTVKQIWQYGKERGTETWARASSDVDFLPELNNVLFLPGFDVPNNDDQLGGKFIELDYNTKIVVFEAEINSPGITFFQAERLTLYPE